MKQTPKAKPIPQATLPGTTGQKENGYPDKAKTSGIKMRGTGAATKGVMSRGPMA